MLPSRDWRSRGILRNLRAELKCAIQLAGCQGVSVYEGFCRQSTTTWFMLTDDLDFHLPPELIAQTPSPERSTSRLLHYRRSDGQIRHHQFADLVAILRAGDLLVFNDTRVIPARFYLHKSSGGRIEGLFLVESEPGIWMAMLRNMGDARRGTILRFETEPEMSAEILRNLGGGEFQLQINSKEPARAILDRLGRMPLPPYIKRDKHRDSLDELDRLRYQTVYAREDGAVAAPTAGLHFTPELLERLKEAGVERAFVTLHVGVGTFKPILTDTLESHPMHSERYSISASAADALNLAKHQGRRIIAVGTTAARVLESQDIGQPIAACEDQTSIFIYPPYQWRFVDGLLTNFHLPRSTLIALVAAMVGLEEQRRIYAEAISQRYRFFSYGDAMLVE